MELKQNPFSLYDFLGYLIPGLLFVFGILVLSNHLALPSSPLSEQLQSINDLTTSSYIPIILIAYVSGHFLSYCSSMTIERYSEWTLGFPSKFLLSDESKGYFDIGGKSWIHYIVRFAMFLVLLPISMPELILGKWLSLRTSYAKRLEENLSTLINKRLSALINNTGNYSSSTNDGFFRYFYHYAVENSKAHLPKMQNYVALFGFLRTLTLLSVALFWVVFYKAFCIYGFNTHILTLLILLSVVSFIFYLSFVKFYRRFSLEVFMAVSVC